MSRFASLGRKVVGRTIRGVAALPGLGGRFCCVCSTRITMFLPYAPSGLRRFRVPPLMSALATIGSDVRNFTCPRCLSHDRERHLVLYMRATGVLEAVRGARILHMAPEARLASIIESMAPARYVRGDLHPQDDSTEHIDLERIPYPDSQFDLLLANHVLEHVGDDEAALREITRVLAPGGRAILQTPYSPVLSTTFSDPGIQSPVARLHAYGQEDHVRLYGADVFARFSAWGLLDLSRSHGEVLPQIDPARYGVNPAEPFFMFQKSGGTLSTAAAT